MADKLPVKANYTGSDVTSLGEFSSGDTIPVSNGGTGATSASGARTNLGLVPGTDVASLVGGKIPTAQIPDIAISDYLGSVANQAAMLALTGEKGDWCNRSDTGTVFVISGNDPTLVGSWTQLNYPTAPVTSVSGKTGSVTLEKADVGLGNVDNTSDANKPISTATQTALDGKQPLDADLTAIAGLAGTSGLLKKTAADSWALDTASYLTSNQSITVSGDASGSGTTAISLTLANSGVSAGTYKSVTVDAKGRVTGGTNPTTLSGYGITDAQSQITTTGLLKGAGAGSISAATAETDYVTPTGTGTLSGKTITGVKETKTAPSISAGTLTLDCSAGNIFAVSLNANITTLSFTNVPATGTAYGLTLALTANGTAYTVTWGSAVKWPGGTAPTLTSTSGKVDTFVLTTWDGGTTWYAFIGGQAA